MDIRSKWMSFLFPLFLVVSSSLLGKDNQVEINDGLGEVIYIEAPALFKCRVLLPEGYDAKKNYPLVVGLHGRYADAEYAISVWKRFGLTGFIYAAPQAPYPEKKGYGWGTSNPEVSGLWNRTKAASENYIAEIVRYLIKRYSVNVDEVYLMGHSQGAAVAYSAGIKNHELFKGLICFSGWLNDNWLTDESIKKANGLRVFVAHGKGDEVVRYQRGIEARGVLKKYGYDVTFIDFDGGHDINEEAAKAVAEWTKKK